MKSSPRASGDEFHQLRPYEGTIKMLYKHFFSLLILGKESRGGAFGP